MVSPDPAPPPRLAQRGDPGGRPPGRAQRTLTDWFAAGLRAAPDLVALRLGQREFPYTQVHELALTWAGTLLAACDGEPGAVGVLASRTPESYIGMLAALYAGSTVVPLNPDFPLERTTGTARAVPGSAVIMDSRGFPVADALRSAIPGLPILAPRLGASADAAASAGLLAPDHRSALRQPAVLAPSKVAYVLFTSGSTGRPKGAPITHANMDHFLRVNQARYGCTTGDVFSQTFDQTFDLFMFDLFMAWGCGARLVSTPPQVFIDLPRFIEREGLTFWFSVPSAISLVRRRGGLSPGSMPSLRWSLFCGEALRATDAADWHVAAPGSVLENLYGPTELTIACSVHRWSPDEPGSHQANGIVPIGSLYPGLDYLLAADDEPGSGEGELCVSGPQMFPGYLDASDNEGRFLHSGGRTWYRTGDRARMLPDGELAYLGRTDHQIKIRGYRVELYEIESCLRACPEVAEAVAVPVTYRGQRAIAAFHTGGRAEHAALVSQLRAAVPEFMVPRWFWHLDALPMNANRKIDRAVLASLAQQRADGAET
jgi:amino acid adenylation domain-containing protein